ncbi:MAG: helix-turn-helix transcriptional regulator [Candidatus Gastranaerophilales bacterium]
MKTKISFGNNVKKIRISKNLTQEQLSEMIEIDLRQLARIESGNSFVTAETLEKICITLQIQPKDLFDYDLLNNKKSNEFIELEKKYNQIDLNIRKKL